MLSGDMLTIFQRLPLCASRPGPVRAAAPAASVGLRFQVHVPVEIEFVSTAGFFIVGDNVDGAGDIGLRRESPKCSPRWRRSSSSSNRSNSAQSRIVSAQGRGQLYDAVGRSSIRRQHSGDRSACAACSTEMT